MLGAVSAGVLATSRGVVALALAAGGAAALRAAEGVSGAPLGNEALSRVAGLVGATRLLSASAARVPASMPAGTLELATAGWAAAAAALWFARRAPLDSADGALSAGLELLASASPLLPSSCSDGAWAIAALLGTRSVIRFHRLVGASSSAAAVETRTLAGVVVGLILAASRGHLLPARATSTLLVLLLLHQRRLFNSLAPVLARGIPPERQETDGWMYQIAHMANLHALFFVATPIAAVAHAINWLANAFTPRPFTFYCHPGATLDGGEGSQMGAAYYVGPPVAHQPKPAVFVCNSAVLNRGEDAAAVADNTQKMTDSLTHRRAPEGFAGQYLINIPEFDYALRRPHGPWFRPWAELSMIHKLDRLQARIAQHGSAQHGTAQHMGAPRTPRPCARW